MQFAWLKTDETATGGIHTLQERIAGAEKEKPDLKRSGFDIDQINEAVLLLHFNKGCFSAEPYLAGVVNVNDFN